MSNSKKDRHQSKIDFLESLQIEYFVNDIKSKIYPKQNDRNYYKRVKGHKEEKILNLAFNMGGVVNIFDDETEFERFKSKTYPKDNLPQFELTEIEKDYYYSENSEIKVNIDNKYKIGILISKNFEKNIAIVKLRGEANERTVSLNFVSRIL